MQPTQLLSPAVRSLLSTFVAEAIGQADLPPLTRPEDEEFLAGVWTSVIDAFWEAYVNQLGELAQQQLLEAGKDETGEKLWTWLQEYADFEKNEGARLLAQEIMADFQEKLPPILEEAHRSYHNQFAPPT